MCCALCIPPTASFEQKQPQCKTKVTYVCVQDEQLDASAFQVNIAQLLPLHYRACASRPLPSLGLSSRSKPGCSPASHQQGLSATAEASHAASPPAPSLAGHGSTPSTLPSTSLDSLDAQSSSSSAAAAAEAASRGLEATTSQLSGEVQGAVPDSQGTSDVHMSEAAPAEQQHEASSSNMEAQRAHVQEWQTLVADPFALLVHLFATGLTPQAGSGDPACPWDAAAGQAESSSEDAASASHRPVALLQVTASCIACLLCFQCIWACLGIPG